MNVNLDRKLKVWYLHSDNKRMSMISSKGDKNVLRKSKKERERANA